MPSVTFDPQLLVRGAATDIARLKQLNSSKVGRAALQEGLTKFLGAFLGNQNHADEDIFYAGSFFMLGLS